MPTPLETAYDTHKAQIREMLVCLNFIRDYTKDELVKEHIVDTLKKTGYYI